MSSGGVFTLIANEGRTDRLLLATALLNQRIHDIQCARRAAGKQDCWPTLVDIERTHVLFTNAHYKPFVAIGYEYAKVKAQNGVPAFGSTVTFSIPQFGDFFYDIVCRVRFNNWQCNFDKTPAQNSVNPLDNSAPCGTGGTWDTETGENIYDITWWSKKFPANSNDGSQLFRLVNYLGEVLVVGGDANNLVAEGQSTPPTITSACDLYNTGDVGSVPSNRSFVNLARWVEYPANRLFKKVWFNVNNNPLDEYYDYTNAMYQKFCVQPNKETGYNRMCGQEIPHDAWSGVKRFEVLNSDSSTASAKYNWLSPLTWFQTGIEPATVNFQRSDAGTNNFRNSCNPNANIGSFFREDVNNGLGNGDLFHFGDPLLARYLEKVVDGPQTPKEVQPSLEIMHRLLFWFNDDVRLAIPSVSIPYGQRFISIDLAEVGDMIDQYPGLYVEKIYTDMNTGCLANCDQVTVAAIDTNIQAICGQEPEASEDVFNCIALSNWFKAIYSGASCAENGDIAHAGTGIKFFRQDGSTGCAPDSEWVRGGRPCGVAKVLVEYFPYVQEQTTSNLTIENMDMYINNIFVNPEIHDIYIRRIGFTLIRVHRHARITINEQSGEKLINQLKWPVEYLFVGVRPNWNVNRNNRWMWRDWHRMTKVDTGFFPDEGVRVDLFAKDLSSTTAQGGNPTVTQNLARLERRSICKSEFAYESNTVDTLSVAAHGIVLYDYFSSLFYNSYLPFQYGGYNIRTPNDPGALMINFCLYPKTYQPSGHLNVSRAREFYIRWSSSYVSTSSTAELLVVASTINFLLISDGSAVLRYST
jgi:hypothetical protein